MKYTKLLVPIILYVVLLGINYLSAAFYAVDFAITNWSDNARAYVAMMIIMCLPLSFAITLPWILENEI